ncbi:hypothetical protein CspeluHIS016_0501850 [Cutaneotrichosporon spelunceum]|uniref:RING-type domain-containing protein n=1 Tax=Cutaneotrichosporon spelunceum TaxID=1672016 RepID=A0AAD3TWE1_9TREE|nr:hypothetical protein CspeluHIS016_0501850 [Cutaneotrichosporon spelunceum]
MSYGGFKERLEANLAKQHLSLDALGNKPCFNQLSSRMQTQIRDAIVAAQDPAWDDRRPGTRMSHVTNALKKGWTPSHLLFTVADMAAQEAAMEAHAIAERMGVTPTTVYIDFKQRLEFNLTKQGLNLDAVCNKPCLNQLGSRMQSQIFKALMASLDPAWDDGLSGSAASLVPDALKKGWTPSHLLFIIVDRAAREAQKEALKVAESPVAATAMTAPVMAAPATPAPPMALPAMAAPAMAAPAMAAPAMAAPAMAAPAMAAPAMAAPAMAAPAMAAPAMAAPAMAAPATVVPTMAAAQTTPAVLAATRPPVVTQPRLAAPAPPRTSPGSPIRMTAPILTAPPVGTAVRAAAGPTTAPAPAPAMAGPVLMPAIAPAAAPAVDEHALLGALRHSIAAVQVTVDRLAAMSTPFQNQLPRMSSIHDAESDANMPILEASSAIEARLREAFRAANWAAAKTGHGFAIGMALDEIQRCSDQRLASSHAESAREAQERLAASLINAELQSCQRLEAALIASKNVVAGRVEEAVRQAEDAAEHRRQVALQNAADEAARLVVEEARRQQEEARRASQHMERLMQEQLAAAEWEREEAVRQARSEADQLLAIALDEASAAADAKVQEALEATAAADDRLLEEAAKARMAERRHEEKVAMLNLQHKDRLMLLQNSATSLMSLKMEWRSYKKSVQRMEDDFAQQKENWKVTLQREAEKLEAADTKHRQCVQELEATHRQRLEEVEAAAREEVGANLCVICLDVTADQMPFQCQHIIMCLGCAERIVTESQQCPFCLHREQRARPHWRVFLAA